MNLYTMVVDDVLRDPEAARAAAVACDYGSVTAPDGVEYPGICNPAPEPLAAELNQAVADAVGAVIRPRMTFLRLTLAGTPVPHWAHTDLAFGSYTALLYLSSPQACRGREGTLILEHDSGMDRNPTDVVGVATWKRDANTRSAWRRVSSVPMRFNRMVIIASDLFHAASPGFGSTPGDGRLVLTSFFTTGGS